MIRTLSGLGRHQHIAVEHRSAISFRQDATRIHSFGLERFKMPRLMLRSSFPGCEMSQSHRLSRIWQRIWEKNNHKAIAAVHQQRKERKTAIRGDVRKSFSMLICEKTLRRMQSLSHTMRSMMMGSHPCNMCAERFAEKKKSHILSHLFRVP